MARRIHVDHVRLGEVKLSDSEAHHARDVLRLTPGTAVEIFDDAGRVAGGMLMSVTAAFVTVTVQTIVEAAVSALRLTIAAAVPKGDRADWMVEKLSELGVWRFIPVAAGRSVVLPTGKNKIERWARIAIESAKQARRAGVMEITELTPLEDAIGRADAGWFLSTQSQTQPIKSAIESLPPDRDLTMFIGPEGGWTDDEIAGFNAAKFTGVGLTTTILRVETAAIAAAALLACHHRAQTIPFCPA